MSTRVQWRRGNTAQTAAFTGATAEITVDTDKNVVVVHDGVTAGGHPAPTIEFTQAAYNKANASYNAVNTLSQSELTNGSYAFVLNNDGTITIPTAGGDIDAGRIQSAATKDLQLNAGGALFKFGYDNTLTFPDGSKQSKAYKGLVFDHANSGFDQANTAYNQANTAYDQANTGFLQANTAYDQANAAFGRANVSYGQANAAFGRANVSYGQANAAFDKANSAYTAAGNANDYAGQVDLKASAGYAHANAAYDHANSAYDLAVVALPEAGGTITGSLNVNSILTVGVGAPAILPNLVAQFTDSSASYIQISVQNIDGNGSSDIVATADNGTDSSYYTDMGVQGSTDQSGDILYPNDSYLIGHGQDGSQPGSNLVIAATTSGYGDIVFAQGGLDNANESGRFKYGQGLIIETGTSSTSTSSGALVVEGGVGVSGNVYATGIYDNGIELKEYIDSSNTSMKSYVDTANTSMKSYVDTTVSTANTSLKSYTDNAISTANTSMKSYVDTANTSLKSYVDTANTSMQSYVDTANTSMKSYVDTLGGTKLNASGGTISGSLYIQHDLTVDGTVTYTGNVNVVEISGNTGSFFGYTSNGFNALYAGLPGGYAHLPNEIAQFTGANNSYIQINLQNENGGTDATSDWIATANNGDNYSYYVDMGIAGNGYDNSSPDNSLGTSLMPNDSYLYAQGDYNTPSNPGGNLVIGATSTGKHVRFIAGGINSSNVVLDLSPTAVTLSQQLVFSDSSIQTTAASPVAYSTAGFAKANAAFTKANGAVQTGFTTITANGSSITPSSNTDTLTITAATANGISILNPSSKTIDIGLYPSGVTAKTYGDASNIPSITVDAFGRVTAVSNTVVYIPPSTSVYANTGQLTANVATGIVAIGLASVPTVTAGTYSYPSLNIDAYGRVTSISNQTPVTSWNGMTGAVTLSSANVVSALTYTPANKAGDTLSGNFTGIGNLGAQTLTINTSGLVTTNTYTTAASTSQVSVDSFASATYRSAKYVVQMTAGTSYHVIELRIVHDGTSVWMSQYGEIYTGSSLGTFDASITTGVLNLLFTPASATATTVKVVRTNIVV